MAQHVTINEVGPRDGLQNQPKVLSTDDKLKLIDALLAAGIRHIEATSFSSPALVPQMADAADLCARLPDTDSVHYSALVPNLRGYERARNAGVRSIGVVLSCTESMNQRNIRMGLDQAVQVCDEVIRRATADGIEARAYLAVAFVCPFEGRVDPQVVQDLAARMFDAGANELIVADTIGAADPVHVGRLFDALALQHRPERLSGHFHDTQGQALANCFAAYERGVLKFDAAIGGLGGCPFAPGAAGNVATEDLVNMFNSAGLHTGIDLEMLAAAVTVAETSLGRELGGRWMSYRRSRVPDGAR